MNINPGKLNKKIALQKYVATQDEIKQQVLSWQSIRTMFAEINSLYGQEYWAAAGQGQEDTIVFTVRWCKALEVLVEEKHLTQYRILFKGIPYQIKSYDNIKFANKIVKIKAVRE